MLNLRSALSVIRANNRAMTEAFIFSGNFYFSVSCTPQMCLACEKGKQNLKPNWKIESTLWQKQKTFFSLCLINYVGIT